MKNHFVTLSVPNMDRNISVHIITESSGVTLNHLPDTCLRIYLRIGRLVVKPLTSPHLLTLPLLPTLRSMLTVLLAYLKFCKLNPSTRSCWLLKTQLLALTKMTCYKSQTLSLTELLNSCNQLISESPASWHLFQFPRLFAEVTFSIFFKDR